MTREEVIEQYPKNLPVTVAAKIMGKSYMCVAMGLRKQRFPWGYAVYCTSEWSYYINPHHFLDAMGDSIKYIDRSVLNARVPKTSKTGVKANQRV